MVLETQEEVDFLLGRSNAFDRRIPRHNEFQPNSHPFQHFISMNMRNL